MLRHDWLNTFSVHIKLEACHCQLIVSLFHARVLMRAMLLCHDVSVGWRALVSVQAAGLVPIVEPEILIDGDHDIVRFREVTERVVSETVAQLWKQVCVSLPISSPQECRRDASRIK
jgi:hypothetical protein